MEKPSKPGMELDKFKRRLIRAVARLLVQEKKPEAEVWESLKKETGCDCRLLWSRMRAVTLKKLSRLLAAEDCISKIPIAARMSLTDWLLLDQVLVHQEVDLISMDNKLKEDPKPLTDLFELVNTFNIEGRVGQRLTDAWATATVCYNNEGHQCSPMLLQRRWYQLKEATRNQFYTFWYSYRGAAKRLTIAEPHTPSPLQANIARKYKTLVTSPFVEWEELIVKKRIALPEEFEKKMRESVAHSRHVNKASVDKGPDLVVIEPLIETIDLRLDSDNDDASETQTLPATEVKIKQEPYDMEIDIEEHYLEAPKKKSIYDEVLELTVIENEIIDSIDDEEILLSEDELATEENEIKQAIEYTLATKAQQEPVLPQITNVVGNVDDSCGFDNITDNTGICSNVDECHDNLSTICALDINTTITDVVEMADDVETSEPSANPATSTDSIECIVEDDCILEKKDISVSEHTPKEPVDLDSEQDIVEHTIIEPYKVSNGPEDTIISEECIDNKMDIKSDVGKFSFGELSNDINFVDDGIEFVDDGIAYLDENNRSDDMKMNVKSEVDEGIEEFNEGTPIIDAKLLMCPIIYTTRLDDMGLFHTQPFDHVDDKQLLDVISIRSKPKKEVPVDCTSEGDDCDEDIVTDIAKVKVSSYMLQKPRSRTYNPIQLCKNPDFNTRLKRLTVGFFSSPRNRGLLKTCKPLTIDLSKAFESKLIAGTLYLKASDHNVQPEIVNYSESRQNVSVVPSAMPVQSLIDNSKIGDILPLFRSHLVSPKPPDELGSTCERNKIINLPDISEIRRINQRLLTAEVTPIQVHNNTPQVPVSIVASSNITIPVQKTMQITETDYAQPASFSKCPPNIVDITEDLPGKNNIDNTLSSQQNSFSAVPVYGNSSASKHFIVSSNQTYNRVGRLPKLVNSTTLRRWPQKPSTVVWTPRQIRPEIPWLSKNQETSTVTRQVDETLLTLDTLNKMLYLLAFGKESMAQLEMKTKPKKKKKNIRQLTPDQSPQLKAHASSEVQIINEADVIPKPINNKSCKPRINIKAATNYPRKKLSKTVIEHGNSKASNSNQNQLSLLQPIVEDTSLQSCTTTPALPSPPQQSINNKEKKGKEIHYCCWARQRMLQLLFSRKRIPVHDCPFPLCTCCCRILLQQYTVNERKLINAEIKGNSINPDVNGIESQNVEVDISENIIMPDETSDESHVKAPIEVLVEKSIQVPDDALVETSTKEPVKAPVETLIETPIKEAVKIPVEGLAETPIEATFDDPVEGLAETSITADVEAPVETHFETPVEIPVEISVGKPVEIPVVDVEASNDEPTNENEPINTDVLPINVEDTPALGGEVSVSTSTISTYAVVSEDATVNVSAGNGTVSTNTDPFIKKYGKVNSKPRELTLRVRQNTVLTEAINAKTISPTGLNLFTPPSLTEVLASKKTQTPNNLKTKMLPKVKPPTPAKNFKEKMIFLNSKQIAERPSDNPIFLGKNKILLTTVKFPPNLKMFEAAKKSLASTLNLPDGVQIICLPNGTVTYTVDPNIEINASDLALLPEIIASVQKKVNSKSNVPQDVPKVSVVENEVVNLTDDDDDIPMVVETINSEIPPVAEVQSIDVDQTERSDNTLNDSTHTETKENLTEPDNESVKNNFADSQIEVNQNISLDLNTSNGNQEIYLESSNKEIISTSAGQDLSQKSNTNTIVNVNENSTSEPSSGHKGKNILSDLMEMSGIFDEDITPTPRETLPPESVQREPAMSEDSVELPPLLPLEPLLPQITEPQPTISVNNIPPVVNSPIGELSPITSLYELKYACLNNGIFFKLDFDTGYLVPINVCMKQHPKPILPKAIETKLVIDLTDDDDFINTSNTPENRSLLIVNNEATASTSPVNTHSSNVKPLKLFKSANRGILRRIHLDKPFSHEKQNVSSSSSNDKRLKHKRKQLLRETKFGSGKDIGSVTAEKNISKKKFRHISINLDLDRVVETNKGPSLQPVLKKIRPKTDFNSATDKKPKQYVRIESKKTDSDNTDNNKTKSNEQPGVIITSPSGKETANLESDDSSDEEPLAKKAKRKRENEVPPTVGNHMQETLEVAELANLSVSENESMEQERYYELDLNSEGENEDEGNCILGV